MENDAKSGAARQLIDVYGALLDEVKLGPAEVLDESALPGPKAEIAAALLSAYHGDFESGLKVSQIQGWLIELAQFQPDVGEPILDIAWETARRVARARRDKQRIETVSLSREVAEESQRHGWRKRSVRFRAAVDRDRTHYLNQLKG